MENSLVLVYENLTILKCMELCITILTFYIF